MTDTTSQPGLRPPSPVLALVPWLVIPAGTLYLAQGQVLPIEAWRFGVDVAASLVLGLALTQLHSFPRLQQPVWAPVVVVVAALAPLAPTGGFAAAGFFALLLGLTAAPAWWVAGRFRLPWWAATALVGAGLLLMHGVHQYGDGYPGLGPLRGMVRDATWPLRSETLPAAREAGPPVILISVDTLRADHALEMRSFQRLAERGAHWGSALSTSSWTLPATASMITGQMPDAHGAGCLDGGHCQGLADTATPVAEELAAAGYRTLGVVTNPWLGHSNGIDRGFHVYRDLGSSKPRRFLFGGASYPNGAHQDGALTLDVALAQLDRVADGGAFFLWVHLLDPHMPYLHSEDPAMQALTVQSLRNATLLSDADRQRVRDAYANEVRWLDGALERFLDALEQRGLLDRSLVVLTSDHGEELWEHGGVEHGHSHHAEVVEVPLVISGPGVQPGPREGAASLRDVAHTLRHAAGLPSDGVDLREPVPDGRIVEAYGNLHVWVTCSARDTRTRVIVDGCTSETDRRVHGYDLRSDPGELLPFVPPVDEPVRLAAEAVEGLSAHEASDQNTAALRALGYVE